MTAATPPPRDLHDVHGPYSWAFRYLLDWGRCGDTVTPTRLYSTALRWYYKPHHRRRMIDAATRYARLDIAGLNPQLLGNWDDLVASDIAPTVTILPEDMANFLTHLHGGDFTHGGPFRFPVPQRIADLRPGYAFLWSAWLHTVPGTPCPWPFWIFPGREMIVAA